MESGEKSGEGERDAILEKKLQYVDGPRKLSRGAW